jgi:putative membrane protein
MSLLRRLRHRDRLHLLRAGLLLGFAAVIAKLFVAGQMNKYMAPALDPLTALTGVVLAVMGVVELLDGSDHAQHGEHRPDMIEETLTYLLVLMPLGLALIVTPRALDAGALGGENAASLLLAYAPGSVPSPGAEPPTPLTRITDTADLLAYLRQAGVSGIGQRVRATGLALRSETLGEREFVLLRYSVAHCVADARPVALLMITSSGNAQVPVDQWVEVDGVLGLREREGNGLVSIVAERVRLIAEPENPYLRSSF